MRENGMPETKFHNKRTFDYKSFNSNRRFYEKVYAFGIDFNYLFENYNR